jgi:L-ascorbate metabolism protein UlaG (beta-lactamase superfamily)
MEIWYLGFGSFRIKTQKDIIITDPYLVDLGPKMPSLEANLVTISRPDSLHNHYAVIKGQPFVISAPGEYEISGINILGIPSYYENEPAKRSDNTIYLIHDEGIKIAHLGQLNHPLAKTSLDQIDSPDILFLPLALEENSQGLEVKYASQLARQIEAKIIIPIHYIKEAGNVPSEQIEPIAKFLTETGNIPKTENKLIISQANLENEEERLVLLESRSQ